MSRHDPRMPEPPSRPPPGETAASPREGETLDEDLRAGASGGTRTPAGTDYGDWVPGAGDGQVTPPRTPQLDTGPGGGWGREAGSLAGGGASESLDPNTSDTLGSGLTGAGGATSSSSGGSGAFGLGGGQQTRDDGGGFGGTTGSGYGYAGSAGTGVGATYAGAQGTTRAADDGPGAERYRRIADEFAQWRRVAQQRQEASSGQPGGGMGSRSGGTGRASASSGRSADLDAAHRAASVLSGGMADPRRGADPGGPTGSGGLGMPGATRGEASSPGALAGGDGPPAAASSTPALDVELPGGPVADDLARRSAVPGMTTPDDGVPVQDLPRNLPT